MSEAFKCDICKKFTEGESRSTETSKQDYEEKNNGKISN